MAAETFDVDNWLVETLLADAEFSELSGGRLYPGIALLATPSPYVVHNLQSGIDDNTIGGKRGPGRMVYAVLAVTTGSSFSPLGPLVSASDRLLHGAAASLPSCEITVSREGFVRYPDFKDNVRYNLAGAMYAVTFQPHT